MVSAKYPKLIKKLIIVGSGPFKSEYTKDMMATRLSRLSVEEKSEAELLLKELSENTSANPDTLQKFGKLMSKSDSYNLIVDTGPKIELQQEIYKMVWPEAAKLRESGELLQMGTNIECPVVAIHGDYDPHPAEGVRDTISTVIKDFRFILLNKCGHKPWGEIEARDEFYRVLNKEII